MKPSPKAIAILCLMPFSVAAEQAAEQPELTKCNNHGPETCVPFAGCYGLNGVFFHGAAWANNTLVARRSDNVLCAGTWKQTAAGLGKADFTCAPDETAQVVYFIQESQTGTTIGSGFTSLNQKILVWSGLNLKDFFATSSKTGLPVMTCGPVDVPIS